MNAAEWVRERVSSAPRELVDAMVAAAAPYADLPAADGLAEAALALYRRVAAGAGTRADALDLLAADALFTHAFQAQAEMAPDALGEFAECWSGQGRLAEVVP